MTQHKISPTPVTQSGISLGDRLLVIYASDLDTQYPQDVLLAFVSGVRDACEDAVFVTVFRPGAPPTHGIAKPMGSYYIDPECSWVYIKN